MRLIDQLLARIVAGADDATLERRFGSPVAQRIMFVAMARRFRPEAARGFQGALAYELTRTATDRPPIRWTIVVSDGRARAVRGAAPDPKLAVRFELADFVRIGAGKLDPVVPVLQ